MGVVKEILYFDKPDQANTDEMVEFAIKRVADSEIRRALIVYSSGHTFRKFQEVTKNAGLKFDTVVETNAKGAHMPIVIRPEDNEETKRWKEDQLKKGITGTFISITDETREEMEKQGIKVYYVPDYLGLGEPLAEREGGNPRRAKLAPFVIPQDLRPLDIDAGWDLSILTIVSQGLRVCVGCMVVAVQNGLIPEGETVLTIGGRATALIMQAGSSAKTCLIKEIIGYDRGSSWFERGFSMREP